MRMKSFAWVAAVAALVPAAAMAVQVRGEAGAITYTGEAARLTTPGATYGALMELDLTDMTDLELGYAGAAYMSDESIGDDQSAILENGGQALLKLGPDTMGLHPHLFAGLEYTRVSVLEDGEVQGFIEDGSLLKLPLGAGVAYSFRGEGDNVITVGARASYNVALMSEAFPTLENTMSSNQVTGTMNVGGSF